MAKTATKSKQATAMAQQVQQNKKNLLEALEKSLGVVTTACKTARLDRTTFYNYVNSDPEFAAKVKDIEDIALDFVETKFHHQISKGDTTACIFYLKTKGKARGYVERQEITGKDGKAIQTENKHDLSKLSTDEIIKLKEINNKLGN